MLQEKQAELALIEDAITNKSRAYNEELNSQVIRYGEKVKEADQQLKSL